MGQAPTVGSWLRPTTCVGLPLQAVAGWTKARSLCFRSLVNTRVQFRHVKFGQWTRDTRDCWCCRGTDLQLACWVRGPRVVGRLLPAGREGICYSAKR